MNKLIYKWLIKLVEIALNEKLRPFPSVKYLKSEIDPVELEPVEIPYDYKILIAADDINDAALYAHSLFLEPSHWKYVNSTQDIHYYNQDKCEIHLAGNWFKSAKIHELLNWANKHAYTVK